MKEQTQLEIAEQIKKREFQYSCFVEFMKTMFGFCRPKPFPIEKEYTQHDMERAFFNGWSSGVYHDKTVPEMEAYQKTTGVGTSPRQG